jgi:hypothetical protein
MPVHTAGLCAFFQDVTWLVASTWLKIPFWMWCHERRRLSRGQGHVIRIERIRSIQAPP